MKGEKKNTSILDIVGIYLFLYELIKLVNVGSKVKQNGRFEQATYALGIFFKTNQCLSVFFV